MSADVVVVNCYIQLTNHFVTNVPGTDEIVSLADWWEKHGSIIAQMIKCGVSTFRTADEFYEHLHRKISLINGSLAEALDPRKAAIGDVFEICKFFALFLEILRKDHSDMLTTVLENLASQSGFNSGVLIEMFAYFDKLYSEDTADDWWTCLTRSTEDSEASAGLRTPKRNNFSAATFTTPTATARRLRNATSTARRSPIAEAVDSPTMRFMRLERELKHAKNRLREAEQDNEDMRLANQTLKEDNRLYKITIDSLKADLTGKRESAEDSQQRVNDLNNLLEKREKEAAALTRHLDESRATVRTQQRELEELEAEKEKIAGKLTKAKDDFDKCMKQLRQTRDTNDQEFDSYRRKEQELTDKLLSVTEENAELLEHLTAAESLTTNLKAENDQLMKEKDESNLIASRNKQDAENVKAQLDEERKHHQMLMEKIQAEKAERLRIAHETIDRLEKELKEETSERIELNRLFSELNEKILKDDVSSHDQNEQVSDTRALMEQMKRQMDRMQVDLNGKSRDIVVLKGQLDQAKDILANEQVIRESVQTQNANKISSLEKLLAEKNIELEGMRQNMDSLIVKHQAELESRDEKLQAQLEENRRAMEEYEKLQKLHAEAVQKDMFMEERIKLLEGNDMNDRPASPDSLIEFLATDGENVSHEELKKIVEQTPRKSVAFHVNGDETLRGTPIGYKMDPRESICSIDLDRASTARSSIRSDTFTIASNGEFKQPYTPSGPSKERVGVLAARNEKVKPHLQSAYATELADVNSPSADEENVRKGGGKSADIGEQKPKKKRRDSFFMFGSSKK